ncbi:MAG: DM13 domain-containing protein [Actinobacteria bacterium]|nr:DM13 domain-containing protein [Actinomycetota bacterium]
MKLPAIVRRHPRLAATAVVVGIGLFVFGIVWFEPHKLFIDDTVNEALPTPSAEPMATSEPTPTQEPTATEAPTATEEPTGEPAEQAGPVTLRRGEFHPLEHGVEGSARIIRLADGSLFLRFEGFETSNGPDLRVYLSELPLSDEWRIWDDAPYLDLGDLKGNIGNQNYELPGNLDLDRWRTAVVWCRRFTVGFAVAPLDPA